MEINKFKKISDLKKIRKFTIEGITYFQFEYFNSWQLFQNIANIIERKISVEIIKKIDGDWFRIKIYKKMILFLIWSMMTFLELT